MILRAFVNTVIIITVLQTVEKAPHRKVRNFLQLHKTICYTKNHSLLFVIKLRKALILCTLLAALLLLAVATYCLRRRALPAKFFVCLFVPVFLFFSAGQSYPNPRPMLGICGIYDFFADDYCVSGRVWKF